MATAKAKHVRASSSKKVKSGHPRPYQVRKLPQLIFLKPGVALREAHIKPGQVVADLGAGGGYLTIPAAIKVGGHGLVYAVEILKEGLANIRSQAKIFGLTNISTIWADLEIPRSTKIPDNAVDVSLIFKVLCWQKKRDIILAEAFRITKPGGRVIVAEWCEAQLGFGPGRQKVIARPELEKIASSAGLQKVKEHRLDDFHYILEFKIPK